MTPAEKAITNLFPSQLERIRREFGDAVCGQIVTLLADQILEQIRMYEAEGRYLYQRNGKAPSYEVAVDFAAIIRDLREDQDNAVAWLVQKRRAAAPLN